MKSFVCAALLVFGLVALVDGDDKVHCFKPDPHRDAVLKECKEKVKGEKEQEESLWKCFMNKMEVIVNETMDFERLHEIIDKYAVDRKRILLNAAVNECMPQYNTAAEKKIDAFYVCYAPKFFKEICPLGM